MFLLLSAFSFSFSLCVFLSRVWASCDNILAAQNVNEAPDISFSKLIIIFDEPMFCTSKPMSEPNKPDVLAPRTKMRFQWDFMFQWKCFYLFFNSICVFWLSLCGQKVFAQLFFFPFVRSRFIAETMFGIFWFNEKCGFNLSTAKKAFGKQRTFKTFWSHWSYNLQAKLNILPTKTIRAHHIRAVSIEHVLNVLLAFGVDDKISIRDTL